MIELRFVFDTEKIVIVNNNNNNNKAEIVLLNLFINSNATIWRFDEIGELQQHTWIQKWNENRSEGSD